MVRTGNLCRDLVEGRHRATLQRRFPPAVWIVPTALVALGVVLFLLFRGGGGDGLLDGSDNTIPAFDFRLTRAVPILVTHNKPTKFDATARDVGAQVGDTMTAIYTEAFLDPANWRDGSYDEVWPLFQEASQAAAQEDGTTLAVVSTGQYFLRSVSDGWLVYAFSVSRDDHEVVASSPGPSASATAASS